MPHKIFFRARKAIEIVEAAEIDCPYSPESLNPVPSSSDLTDASITIGSTVSSCVPEDQMALLFLNDPSGENGSGEKHDLSIHAEITSSEC